MTRVLQYCDYHASRDALPNNNPTLDFKERSSDRIRGVLPQTSNRLTVFGVVQTRGLLRMHPWASNETQGETHG